MFDVKDDALNRAVNHATQSQLLYIYMYAFPSRPSMCRSVLCYTIPPYATMRHFSLSLSSEVNPAVYWKANAGDQPSSWRAKKGNCVAELPARH